ncbi:MAG: hypothetical protein WCF90_02570 [Methanomicrobiales archaeon]
MLATFAVPLLAGLYWRGATREGALAGLSLELISSLITGGLNYFKTVSMGIEFAKTRITGSSHPKHENRILFMFTRLRV